MDLNEAKQILNENGYIIESNILNEDWSDIITYLGMVYGVWSGFKTIGNIITSSNEVGLLKKIIDGIEKNKARMAELALDALNHSKIPHELQLKLESLSYKQIYFLIQRGLTMGRNEVDPTGYVSSTTGNSNQIREYRKHIITLYADILYEVLHDDDEDIKDKLEFDISNGKELTSLKNRLKNIWNNIVIMWKQEKYEGDKYPDEDSVDFILNRYSDAEKKRLKNPKGYKEMQKNILKDFNKGYDTRLKHINDFIAK